MMLGGVNGWIRLEDANTLAEFAVVMGRMIPAKKWVEDMIAEEQDRELDRIS